MYAIEEESLKLPIKRRRGSMIENNELRVVVVTITIF